MLTDHYRVVDAEGLPSVRRLLVVDDVFAGGRTFSGWCQVLCVAGLLAEAEVDIATPIWAAHGERVLGSQLCRKRDNVLCGPDAARQHIVSVYVGRSRVGVPPLGSRPKVRPEGAN